MNSNIKNFKIKLQLMRKKALHLIKKSRKKKKTKLTDKNSLGEIM